MESNKQNLIQDVREFSRLMVRELGMITERMNDQKMNHSECHALIELEKNGTLNHKELAERLNLEKSTVSRLISKLLKKKWVQLASDQQDSRMKLLQPTALGLQRLNSVHCDVNRRVEKALDVLGVEECTRVVEGLKSYAMALRRSRLKASLQIRTVKAKDNAQLSRVILQVLKSFVGEKSGFATRDEDLLDMAKSYADSRSRFFVVTAGDKVLGGAGIGALVGGDGKTCELRKMYLLPEAQGLGLGRQLLEKCLVFAKAAGYTRCYLETLHCMSSANALYDKFGFKDIPSPLGCTGHHGCDRWRVLKLSN